MILIYLGLFILFILILFILSTLIFDYNIDQNTLYIIYGVAGAIGLILIVFGTGKKLYENRIKQNEYNIEIIKQLLLENKTKINKLIENIKKNYILNYENNKILNNIENYINRKELEDENYYSVNNVNIMHRIYRKLELIYNKTDFDELKNIEIPDYKPA